MPKLQKNLRKISKYMSKLKKKIYRIGIAHSEDFDLNDSDVKELLLPCHLGILFFNKFDSTLFDDIKAHLDQIYDSFFFNIRNLGKYDFSDYLFSKGVKKEYKEMKKSSSIIKTHPTNKFYQILINKRIEEQLGIIIAITNLPIYSSNEDNFIFLFGEAHLKHNCCVISSLTLNENFYNRPENDKLFKNRVIKEVIHEIGHIFLGPVHCQDDSCVMRYSDDITHVDNKSIELCDICQKRIENVRRKYNF